MGLYPSVWFLDRQVIHPFDLGGYSFPIGTLLVLSPYTLHRNPNYFADPERFDPDRFVSGQAEASPRMAYMPFGHGPRVCLDKHFALLQAQRILATQTPRLRCQTLITS